MDFKPSSSQVDAYMPAVRSWMKMVMGNEPEVVGKFMQYTEDMKTNSELMNEDNERLNELFNEHDTNHDGLLNQ